MRLDLLLARSRIEAPEPGEELAVPQARVLRLEDPVVLVWKVEQTRWYFLRLERVVVLQPLGIGHAVVESAVDDERWCRHALHRGARVLRLDLAEVLPIPGPEFLREERVRIVGEHRDPVEAAGVAHVGAVPALRHMAVHPGDEVAAVAASTGKHALPVHITALAEQRGGS